MSTPHERIAKFCAVYEKIHPRQPLEDSIYGLNTGEPSAAELLLSDLKALLAAATQGMPWVVVEVIDEGDPAFGRKGHVFFGPLVAAVGTVQVMFDPSSHASYRLDQLRVMSGVA